MSLSCKKNRLEVTSPAIVGLKAFLDSTYLPKEGLGGMLCRFFWRDGLNSWYLEVLLSVMFRTQYINLLYILVNLVHSWLSYAILLLL